jgi:hypothetical protein
MDGINVTPNINALSFYGSYNVNELPKNSYHQACETLRRNITVN